jgi:hypothetical protein
VRFLLPDTHCYKETTLGENSHREAPDVVGITSVTPLYPVARRFAQIVKQVNPKIVHMIKGYGISCGGFFMIGLPWETTEQMERTADFYGQNGGHIRYDDL